MRNTLLLLLPAAFGLAALAPTSPATATSPADWSRFSVLTPAGRPEPDPGLVHDLDSLVYWRHRVGPKEWNAWKLAKQCGTTIVSLQATNNSELNVLGPGSQLMLFNKPGRLYQVQKDGETLDDVVGQLTRKPDEARRFKEAIVEANGLPGIALLGPYELHQGDALLEPGVGVITDSYHLPVNGRIRISSGFGMRYHPILHRTRRHDGWDLPKPWGTPVYAARDGRVISAGWKGGYGREVEVMHSNGWRTIYGHLSKITVHVGQRVYRGATVIGHVGSTGLSTGPHLHFEVRDAQDRPVNPGKELSKGGPIRMVLHLKREKPAALLR